MGTAEPTALEEPERKLLIGGHWTASGGGAVFEVTDPATGRPLGTVVDAAIEAAAAAFASWKRAPARDRARILLEAARLVRERSDEIARVMSSEQGKPLTEAAG